MNKFTPLLLTSILCSSGALQADNKLVQIIEKDTYLDSLTSSAPVEAVHSISNSLSALEDSTGFKYDAGSGGFGPTIQDTTAGYFNPTGDATSIVTCEAMFQCTRLTHDKNAEHLHLISANMTGNRNSPNLSTGQIGIYVEWTDGTGSWALRYFDRYSNTASGARVVRDNSSNSTDITTYNAQAVSYQVPIEKHGTVKDVWLFANYWDGQVDASQLGFNNISLTTGAHPDS